MSKMFDNVGIETEEQLNNSTEKWPELARWSVSFEQNWLPPC